MNKILFLSVICVFAVFTALPALAMTPSLSVASTGSSDNVQINVYGDPNSSVLLFYKNSSFAYLGTTNSSGSFTNTLSSATYSITSNSPVYVRTGGISGQQSATVNWPYVSSSSSSTNTLTLSQNAIVLNIGQSSTITSNSNYLYLASNSNPSIANINLSSGQITIFGNSYGTAIANICVLGNSNNCVNLTVTVQNSGSQNLTFSQNNFSLYSGQTVNVTVSGGTGQYIISNNSNTSAVQASLSGSTITLSTTGTAGNASITVCSSNMYYCGVINVNSTTTSSTAISFSQNNPYVQIGQSITVAIYGNSGTNFYVSSNSNPSIVQANITGSTLTLIANSGTGNSAISVCAYAGTCASLTVTVGGYSSGGTIALSQSSVTLLAGQSVNITISGGSAPYNITSNNSSNIFNSNISGNILTIYGVNPGSANANVCSSSGCTNLNITINGINYSSGVAPTFSQNNIVLVAGQSATVYISGGNNNYYIASNSNPNVVTISISGSAAIIYPVNPGSTNISICQINGLCSTLFATVNTTTPVVVNPPVVSQPVASKYMFKKNLYLGIIDADVKELQKYLNSHGWPVASYGAGSAGNETYKFGPATKSALKKFQYANGISASGLCGPITRNFINTH